MSSEPKVELTYWPVYHHGAEPTVRDVCVTVNGRPLVVIDPEDREQVDRLVVAYAEHGVSLGYARDAHLDSERTDSMQAALREFANPTPPKPDEPLLIGAVVEATAYTSEVRTFVRIASGKANHAWWMDKGGNHHAWSELDDPRVLSPGIEVPS